MVDYAKLMRLLSVPRPNGSQALEETRLALQAWLEEQGIPYRLQSFRLYPYFFECTGLWLIFSRTLLALALWLRWGWPALVIALASLPGGLVDVILNFPLVTWPGARTGHNLLIEFEPQSATAGKSPEKELILSAHYDSKTELLDHRQRMFFLKSLPLGIVLTVALGLLGALDGWLLAVNSPWAGWIYTLGGLGALYLLFLAWGLGLNLSLGRLRSPSHGAVDNGTSSTVLLGLAASLAKEPHRLGSTRVTLALFCGEEVNMQGSRAYVHSRSWPLPAAAVNLEVMAQDGPYVYWEQDGNSLKLLPTSAWLNRALQEAVSQVTAQAPCPGGPLNSDGGSFLFAGLPATTLGTYHSRLVDRGFHLPSDNLERVSMDRLPEGVNILAHLIDWFDQNQVSIDSEWK